MEDFTDSVLFNYFLIPGLSFITGLIINEVVKANSYNKKLEKNRRYILGWLEFIKTQILQSQNDIKDFLKLISNRDSSNFYITSKDIDYEIILQINKTLLADTLVFKVKETSIHDETKNLNRLIGLLAYSNYLKTFCSDFTNKYLSFCEEYNSLNTEYKRLNSEFTEQLNQLQLGNSPTTYQLSQLKILIDEVLRNFREKEIEDEKKNTEDKKPITTKIEFLIKPIRKVCIANYNTEQAHQLLQHCSDILNIVKSMDTQLQSTYEIYNNKLSYLADTFNGLDKISRHINKLEIDSWYVKFWKDSKQIKSENLIDPN